MTDDRTIMPVECRPLSELPLGSGWVNLWRTRDDVWLSFVGRIAEDGALEYEHGGRSIHNTVTHWSPIKAAEASA